MTELILKAEIDFRQSLLLYTISFLLTLASDVLFSFADHANYMTKFLLKI